MKAVKVSLIILYLRISDSWSWEKNRIKGNWRVRGIKDPPVLQGCWLGGFTY